MLKNFINLSKHLKRWIIYLCVMVVFCLSLSLGGGKAYAACCGGQGETCGDGYKTGTTECCGKGPCNIFCCHCKNGCRDTTVEGCQQSCISEEKICESNCDLCTEESCFEQCRTVCAREGEHCRQSCPKNATELSSFPVNVDTDRNARMKFTALDTNKDRFISILELKRNRGKVTFCLPEGADLLARFKQLDTNKDGLVSLKEADITPE